MPPQIGQRDSEDRELFPAAARLLSSGQLLEVGLEMAARRKGGAKTASHAGPRSPILPS